MTDKYLLFDLDDDKAKKLGDVISNATSRKIANLLADREMSQSEISKELGLPLNTIDYNIKKLVEAGILEKSKNHLWSEKGKKIENYKIANKLIVISPKKSNVYSKLKGIVPVVAVSVVLTLLILYMQLGSLSMQNFSQDSGKALTAVTPALSSVESAGSATLTVNDTAKADANAAASSQNYTLWVLGAVWILIVAFVVYSLWKNE